MVKRNRRKYMYSQGKGNTNLVIVMKHNINANSRKGGIWMQKPEV